MAKQDSKTPAADAAASTQALVKKSEQALAVAAQFEQTAAEDSGFEEAGFESYALPFLTVLQSLSPQVKKSEAEYIKGAEEGMLFNTATQELMDGEAGVQIVPVHYRRAFLEWVPRAKGGGFKGEMDPNNPDILKCTKNDMGRDILPNGNECADTRIHYVLVVKPDGAINWAVMSMTYTQIKKSKVLMSQLQNLKFKRADGSKFTPPTYASIFNVTTVPESNDKGSWMGWKFERAGNVEDPAIVEQAKLFREALKSGAKKEDFATTAEKTGENGEGVSF